LILINVALSVSLVHGADLSFNTGGRNATYNCDGRDVFVNSGGNSLRFTGYCHSVTVRGSGNRVTVDSADRIATMGTDNTVHWRSERKPVINNTGSNNVLSSIRGNTDESTCVAASTDDQGDHRVVTTDGKNTITANGTDIGGSVGAAVNGALQAAGPATTAAAGVAGSVNSEQTSGNSLNLVVSGRHMTRDCGDGKTVNINGYQNEITLTGRCSNVALNGWDNHLYIEETGSISVSGHTNDVTWERTSNGKRPSTSVLNGYDNSIRQGNLPNR
jgi:hypothetical protein